MVLEAVLDWLVESSLEVVGFYIIKELVGHLLFQPCERKLLVFLDLHESLIDLLKQPVVREILLDFLLLRTGVPVIAAGFYNLLVAREDLGQYQRVDTLKVLDELLDRRLASDRELFPHLGNFFFYYVTNPGKQMVVEYRHDYQLEDILDELFTRLVDHFSIVLILSNLCFFIFTWNIFLVSSFLLLLSF